MKLLRKKTIFILLLLVIMNRPVSAQFFYDESCMKTTGIFTYDGNRPEVVSGMGYTANLGDPNGSGWLRLMPDQEGYALGWVKLEKDFPTTMGVTMEFDFIVWSKAPHGGSDMADGFSVFLFDNSPGKGFTSIGWAGARMGYVGMPNSYLGVQFDEWVNAPSPFSNQWNQLDGVLAGRTDPYSRTNSADKKFNTIVVRKANWEVPQGGYADSPHDLAYRQATPTRPVNNTLRARVELDPIISGSITTGMKVTVYLKQKSGTFQKIIGPVTVTQTTPSRLGMGFCASTGEVFGFHEVQNVIIRTPGDVSVFKNVPGDACATSPNNVIVNTIIANNINAPSTVAVRDSFPATFMFGAPTVTGGTISEYTTTQSGGWNICAYNITVNPETYAYVKFTGSFSTTPVNAQYETRVGITAELDANTADNYARLTGCLRYAVDDYITLKKGETKTFDVRTNDAFNCSGSTIGIVSGAGNDPAQGTLEVNSNQTFTYTAKNITGRDVATYYRQCGSEIITAKVYFSIYENPDNVIDVSCWVTPPTLPWSFKLLDKVIEDSYSVNNGSIPLVGDIDKDGYMEIIVGKAPKEGVSTDGLRIFKFKDGKIQHQQSLTTPWINLVNNPYSIANVNGNDYASIFIATMTYYNTAPADQRRLIRYDYNPTTKLYVEAKRTTAPYSTIIEREMPQPMITDFNGDGIPEVVVYDKVYNARTLELLADGGYLGNPSMGFGYGGHRTHSYISAGIGSELMAIADMDNDGVPEVIGGNTVYKVNITNTSGTSGNSFTVWSQCDKYDPNNTLHPEAVDGATAIADIDLDGYLDIVVSVSPQKRRENGETTAITGALYVWNPRTKKLIHNTTLNQFAAEDFHSNAPYGPSAAFIGDINNDNKPEICLTAKDHMYAYKYASNTLTVLWDKETTDKSGATTMTLFDFDQDGSAELVYRDMTHLRILNGLTGENKITPVECKSGTENEYPVVADVNNDGRAEIVVVGDMNLQVYGSNPIGNWAPARKVWNQFSYNAVNVNEDLTIPRVQMNPATIFPNGKRPFNGYLQQQTMLNINGDPLWLAPNASFNSPPVYDYYSAGDSVRITVDVHNTGEAAFNAPLYISVYKKLGTTTSLVKTDSITTAIPKDASAQKIISIKNLSSHLAFDSLFVSLNDKGSGPGAQPECNNNGTNDNRSGEIKGKIYRLVPDLYTVQEYHHIEMNILANDSLPAGFFPRNFSLLDSIIIQPREGTIVSGGQTGAGSKLVYRSNTALVRDSFQYRIHTTSDKAYTAWVYICGLRSSNSQRSNCYGEGMTLSLLRPEKDNEHIFEGWQINNVYPASADITLSAAEAIADHNFRIKPVLNSACLYSRLGGFPEGDFTVYISNSSTSSRTEMIWTGAIDSIWNNPRNWEVVSGNSRIPARFAPSQCTNVTIPGDVEYFPTTVPPASYASKITMKDRAMIKPSTATFIYDSVAVEIKLKPSERDRYIMWSAPLTGMYSRDYHYRDKNGNPYRGDIFMNLFQRGNPDGGSALTNSFTSSFAALDYPLSLGRAFNLKVVSTTQTKDSLLRLPTSSVGAKFITDAATTMPVAQGDGGNNAGISLIQTVNPYMAYLDFSLFRAANESAINPGYYTWNGDPNDGFILNMLTGDSRDGNRYVSTNPAMSSSPNLIPPLQAFFVAKKTPATSLASLAINPSMITVKDPSKTDGSTYSLRSTLAAGGLLNITLSQGEKKANAALLHTPQATGWIDSGDMPVLVFDEHALAVYTFAATSEALALNSNGYFDIQPVKLGILAASVGEATLTFANMETFGYDAVLVDTKLNRRIDLNTTPSYTFSVTKTGEINDRFNLEMTFTGRGISYVRDESVPQPAIRILPASNGIIIRSTGEKIQSIEIRDIVGRVIYQAAEINVYEKMIHLPTRNVYLAKVRTGRATVVEKILP